MQGPRACIHMAWTPFADGARSRHRWGVWRLMQKTDQCYLCWSPAVSVAGLQAAWQCAERRRSRDLQPSAAECNKPADITAFDPADIDVLCLYVRLQLPDYFQSPTARCLSAAYYFLVIAVSQ